MNPCRLPLRLKLLFQLGRLDLFDAVLELFSGTEFDDHSFRDDDFVLRLVGIAAFAALADLDFENTEVPEFDVAGGGKFVRYVVEGLLDNCCDLVLGESGFLCDPYDKISFRHFLFPYFKLIGLSYR